MKVENPQAFRYIMPDEIYLLPKDKVALPAALPVAEAPAATDNLPVAPQPAAITQTAVTPALTPTPAIVIPQILQPVVETPETGFNYLGSNNKNFLILVNYSNETHMAATHLTALASILQRKELSLDDVAVLNVNKYQPVKLAQLAAYFSPTRLVIMGSDALPEGIGKLPLNQPLQGKKTHVLYSFSFDEMMSSNDNKKTFWEHMKTL
ncbi:hypothetical protein [Mucilaginibacter phyllosphaerae]|uniref:DNA polymerase III psi subunit n=1 Tax=Mucilaginibacter phyllosphaerae TaxID=1812349 RepID=A0A4Y8ABM9_9SPHI|nr:hypothetical protein [Mucilaginibacter phyllosphaerae]MBB3969867.1 DNA polymerase III psi subunit [Mucilaginibacter phyllosphaerae]TEW65241.1 hypothetical protein E2R65_15120 [Mucilaginibacter phyllosphaerae]